MNYWLLMKINKGFILNIYFRSLKVKCNKYINTEAYIIKNHNKRVR
ncbi:hypothetical protein QFZ20_001854 [Flavobacterium sp. W4I14]|nr:hypothetical protein [Flavobacterium sp. W4I14]